MSANNENENQLKKEQWAKKHGLKESKATPHFCLCRLLGKQCREFGSTACVNAPPGSDHASLWLRDGKPAVFVYQPYGLTEVAELGEFCLARGLTCTIATWPAWHNPGSVLHIEIAKKAPAMEEATGSIRETAQYLFDGLNEKEQALVRGRMAKKDRG